MRRSEVLALPAILRDHPKRVERSNNFPIPKDQATVSERKAAIAEARGNCCGICGVHGSVMPLVLDHCHESGRDRGLLCSPCNVGLGFLTDRLDVVQKAARYLEMYG